jgi:hypothetical protein
MKYHVTGINHGTGARMSLDFNATSKAAAQKKAGSAGMDVQHIEEITNGEQPHHEHHSHRGEDLGSGGASALLVKLVILLAILALLAWWLLPKIRAMLHR